MIKHINVIYPFAVTLLPRCAPLLFIFVSYPYSSMKTSRKQAMVGTCLVVTLDLDRIGLQPPAGVTDTDRRIGNQETTWTTNKGR